MVTVPCTFALAQTPYDKAETAEGWAWTQIKLGREVNFKERCAGLAPQTSDACRRISGAFVTDVLTNATLRNSVPFAGVRIIGARIVDDIDLSNSELKRPLLISESVIENDVKLDGVHSTSVIGVVDFR